MNRARDFPPGPSTLEAMRGLRHLAAGTDLAPVPVYLAGLAQQYGGIVHWRMPGAHFYLVDDPALIEEALVFRARDYKKGRGIQRLKRLIGDGLLSSEEPLHLRQRRMMQPAFHTARIAAYASTMAAATMDEIAGWRAAPTLDVDPAMARLALAIAARTLFGADLSGRTAAIRAALTTALETFPAALSRWGELLDALPFLPVTRRFDRARAELDAVIYGMIAARRADPEAGADDLLGMLLAARDDGAAMDDGQVRDEAMTLFLAGHETTANVLSWACYLLARHPAVAERLRAEVDAELEGRVPAAADLPRLRFTRDVVAETMRLYPPAWALGRRALRPTTLGPYRIPAGSVILASQLVTQRNPRYWDDPDAFRPERWSGAKPARFAYFPFGGGERRCIGEAFAWMEAILIVATIAGRVAFAPIDDIPVGIQPLVTLRPREPIRLRVTFRPVRA